MVVTLTGIDAAPIIVTHGKIVANAIRVMNASTYMLLTMQDLRLDVERCLDTFLIPAPALEKILKSDHLEDDPRALQRSALLTGN